MHTLPASQFIFPDPIEVDPEGEGLICVGADLSPSTLYEAYTHGLFPWFSEGDPICWWCPDVSGNVKMTPQQHLKIDPLG